MYIDLEDPKWYSTGPTVEPEADEDDWFDSCQVGKTDLDPNNDLRGDHDAELEERFFGILQNTGLLKSSSRNGAPILWLAIHTAEGARTKESLFRYFNQSNINASSHAGIDAEGIAEWVPDERAAWTLRNGNPYSLNVELCGFARWTRAQWLSTGIVDNCRNPRQMIRNLAVWIYNKARKHGIPLRMLAISQVAARKDRGYIDHNIYTKATKDGSHWDVGFGFPWDILASDIKLLSSPSTPPTQEVEVSTQFIPLPRTSDWQAIALPAENGANSRVVSDMWVTLASAYGDCEYVLIIEDGPGGKYMSSVGTSAGGTKLPGLGKTVSLKSGDRHYYKMPSGAEVVSIKYRTPGTASMGVSVICKEK